MLETEVRNATDLPSLVDSVKGREFDYLLGEMMGGKRMACEFSVLELKKSIGK